MLRFACDPPIPVVQFVLLIYKMKMIYVRLNVVYIFIWLMSFFARCGPLGNCIAR